MRLDKLLTTIAESTATDWEKLDVPTEYNGVCDNGEADEHQSAGPSFHHTLAVYKPDIDVSLAYGAIVARPFQEPWTESFRGPASTIAVWLRYRGAVVYEWVVASVDGGRCVLPLPGMQGGRYVVQERDLPMAQLLFNLMSSVADDETLDMALQRAGLPVVD